jgi:hypothetical protein
VEKMKRTLFITLVGFFVVSLCAGYSLAYTGPTFYKAGIVHGVKYLTGGVGSDERAAIQKTAQGNYNLQFVFAETTGPYLASISVKIQDTHGKTLIDMPSSGPWFFAELPNGQYKITVSHAGKLETQNLNVGTNFRKVIFNWKNAM